MEAREVLNSVIHNFNVDTIQSFFRNKNDQFEFPDEDISINEKNNVFSEGKKIVTGKLQDNTQFEVYTIQVNTELSERSIKKAQFEIGKRILKTQQTDAGIFIFYDQNGSFRFSLLYANYIGKKREFSNYRRFTYYVNKDQTKLS